MENAEHLAATVIFKIVMQTLERNIVNIVQIDEDNVVVVIKK